MRYLLIIFLISSQIYAAGEILWLGKILTVSKQISEKAGDFRKSVKIAEDLKLIEEEQSKELRYQSKFMRETWINPIRSLIILITK